jgi:hypothetical protein
MTGKSVIAAGILQEGYYLKGFQMESTRRVPGEFEKLLIRSE